jgi:SAM-dependent methyltransferase
METLTSCPACGSAAIVETFIAEDFHTKITGSFAMWLCSDCHLHFLNPRPSRSELAQYYPANYYSYQQPAATAPQLAQRLLRGLAPFRAWNWAWERINKRNAWGRTAPQDAQGALLDVGCGAGIFLRHVRKLNPNLRLVGCDPFGPDEVPSLGLQGIAYHHRPVEDCGFGNGEFNFITMNHVLEHQPCPDRLLDEIHRILGPAGVLYIGLPNTEGAGRRLFGRYWCGWDAPRHLVDFGQTSLVKLLAGHGFEVRSVRHMSNSGHLLDSLTYRVFGKAAPPSWWSRQMGQLSLQAVLNPIAGLTNLLALGDNVEVTCVRS